MLTELTERYSQMVALHDKAESASECQEVHRLGYELDAKIVAAGFTIDEVVDAYLAANP